MTLDKEALQGLLDRVREEKGPDRELDRELDGYPVGTTKWRDIPAYTASVDASMALVERLLPDWHIAMGTVGEHDIPWACLTEPEDPCRDFSASAPTIPLALVEALLSANLSQESGENSQGGGE